MKLTLPLRTHSGNHGHGREHWATRAKRVKKEREAVALLMTPWKFHAWRWPVTVVLTRIAPRKLDAEDNLTAALKAVRDEVAAQLGVDDRDERVRWRYGQERGEVREYAVRIEVLEAVCPDCGESLAVPHRRGCSERVGV